MAYYDSKYSPSYLGGEDMATSLGGGAGVAGGAGAASGAGAAGGMAALGGPVGAGLMVGGSFLSNYLAQKAADERAKRDREMQIGQNYAENQNKGFDTLNRAWQGALR